MSWTEERVDTLKKLWSDGLSASQIATQMGEVSRNAVIGKVHRLGLARRALSSRNQMAVPRKAKRAPGGFAKPQFSTREDNVKKVPGHPPDRFRNFEPPRSRIINELVIPLAERASIMTLKECSCRWPIGDPAEDDFHFCGRNKIEGKPYCDFHAKIAYQPENSRRSPRPKPQATGPSVVTLQASTNVQEEMK